MVFFSRSAKSTPVIDPVVANMIKEASDERIKLLDDEFAKLKPIIEKLTTDIEQLKVECRKASLNMAIRLLHANLPQFQAAADAIDVFDNKFSFYLNKAYISCWRNFKDGLDNLKQTDSPDCYILTRYTAHPTVDTLLNQTIGKMQGIEFGLKAVVLKGHENIKLNVYKEITEKIAESSPKSRCTLM